MTLSSDESASQTIQTALPERPATQRRLAYRVYITEDTPLAVTVWRITERAALSERPSARQRIKLRLRNLSLGGMGIFVDSAGEGADDKISPEQRLRVELKYGQTELLLEARVRHVGRGQPGDGRQAVGVQFTKLQADFSGRQQLSALTRIISELQREEARRARLGIKPGTGLGVGTRAG